MFVAAIKKTDLVHFFRTYYRYQKASITTQEFLGMYLRSCDNEEFKEIIQSILTDQKLGSSLSDSLRKHTVFPPYVVQMIAVGEASSLLAPILEKIVFFLIQENDIEKKVEEIREVPHFKDSIEHKILITHVIAKVSIELLAKLLFTTSFHI